MTGAFDYPLFAAAVYRQRRACGLSYRQLSEVVGISFSTLHRIEGAYLRGKRVAVEVDTFARLCEWLQIEPREFFYSE